MYLLRTAVRVAAICLALCFLSVLPQAAQAANLPADASGEAAVDLAAGNSNAVKEGGQAAVSLEEAVRIAKEAFPVPPGLDQFATGFDQSNENAFWTLRWYRSGDPGGEMNVRVNAATGEIWSMQIWTVPAPGQGYRGLPEFTKEQLESTAKSLAEKLQPERFKETRLQPERGDYFYKPPLYQEREQIFYGYYYERTVNGIAYPENAISVIVSGDTGAVTGFDLNWEDTKIFPPASSRITQAEAVRVFRAQCGPKLYYFRPNVPGGKEVPLKLVYRLPGNQNQVLIDALTGKPLDKEGAAYHMYSMAGGGAGDEYSLNRKAASQIIELTPLEESAVREAKNLLSRDKALQAAKSFVKVPGDYTLSGSTLMQDYMFPDQKIWSFSWQGGDGADRKFMSASVNASTGELIGFYKDSYGIYDYYKTPEVKFGEEDARKIAEEMIKKLQPGKWQQVVFESAQPEWGLAAGADQKPLPRSYNFNWVRTAGEIEFPQNGFELNVNSATGEINRFQMNWWEVDFPNPQGTIGKEAAADKYLRESPLSLAYLRLWNQNIWIGPGPEESKIYLAYYTDQRKFAMLDAFTGQLLNYDGNIIETTGKKGQFADIAGHPAQEAIETLASHDIITGQGGQFRPDDAITQAELVTMLVRSKGRFLDPFAPARSQDEKPWYQPYYDEATRMGIIRSGEIPDPNAPVTREALAGLAINTMGLYQAACLKDIYILDFTDAGEISEHLKGHAALSAAMRLIEPAEGKFEPGQAVSRANAAETIIKLLKMAD